MESDLDTLWELVRRQAEAHPDTLAFVARSEEEVESSVTYLELHDRIATLSAALAEIGVRRGDRLALWMTNRPEWILSYLSAARLGATTIPINTWYTPTEVGYILRHSRARHLVVLDRFRHIDFTERLDLVAPGWAGGPAGHAFDPGLLELRNVVVVHRGGDIWGHASAGSSYRFADLAGTAPGNGAVADGMAARVTGSDLAMIQYTSGSTAFPKGVMLEQAGMVLNGRRHSDRLGITSSDRWFSAMPFFHNGGSIWGLMSSLAAGATLYFTESFAAGTSLRMLSDHRCTVWFASPTMVRDVIGAMSSPAPDLTSVRIASASDPAIAEELRSLLPGVATINPYGLSETYAPVALAPPSSPPQVQVTSGWPLEGIEIRAVDPVSHLDAAPGEVGEGWVRGLIMRGYWEQPDATAAAVDEAGWLHTGDLLRIGPDGHIEYVGRLKNTIRVGSENVAVEEVESCILAHPDVHSAVVVGVRDLRRDEVPWCFVQMRVGSNADGESLSRWCRERLASFKVPRHFVFLSELPLTGSGKVDRLEIKEMALRATSGAAP